MSKKMPEHKTYKDHIHAHISVEMKSYLEDTATRMGINLSGLLRMIVSEYRERMERADK